MSEGLLLLLFIGVVLLLVRLSNLAMRLTRLEIQLLDQAQKLRDLTRRLDETSTARTTAVEPIAPQAKLETEQEIAPPEETPIKTVERIEPVPPLAETQVEPSETEKSFVPEPITSKPTMSEPATAEAQRTTPSKGVISFEKLKSTEEWEALIGGNILNRIGALALIFGIGFFLKYAFDNDLISPAVRVLIGVVIGMGLIVGGMYANAKKFEVFSQGLFGAGISTLYLSIYAALNFYELIPQAIAFVLMSAVTAVALLIAVRYDSLAISLLGWAGGFLTPFLLASAEPNAVGLFVYLALLNLGMIAVVFLKSEWVVLELLSLIATYLVYVAWFLEHSEKTETFTKAFFLTLFWMLFLVSEAYRAWNNQTERFRLRMACSVLNAFLYFEFFYLSVMPVWWCSVVTLFIAGVYFGLYQVIQKRNPTATSNVIATYSIGTIAFLAAAIEVQFSNFLTVALWGAEAVGVLWIARRTSQTYLERVAIVLLAIAVFRLFILPDTFSYRPISDFTPIFNLRTVAFLSLTVSLFITGLWRQQSAPTTATLLNYVWAFLAFMLLTVEVNDFFLKREALLDERLDFSRSTRSMSFGIIWLFYAVALLWFGVKNSARSLVNTGLFVLALGVLWNILFGLRFEPIEIFLPILNLRALSFLFVIVGILATISLLEQTNEGKSRTAELLRYVFTLVLFLLITAEAIDYFRWSRLKSNSDESFYRTLTLVLLWALYAMPMIYFGIKKSVKPLFYAGALTFVLLVIVLVFGGFSFDPIENFVVVLNYRVLVYLVVMMSGAFIAIGLSEQSGYERLSTVLGVTAALLGVVLLVAESNDFFGQKINRLSFGEYADATASELSIQYENQKQLSISASLMLYSIALMLYGIWRSRQPIRLTAIALFGLAILKIFIYDLSFLTTLYRIFSFIGLGMLLLLVSFLYQRFRHLILPEKSEARG